MIQSKVAELVMREERYKPYTGALKDLADVDWDVKYIQDERRASEFPSVEEFSQGTTCSGKTPYQACNIYAYA